MDEARPGERRLPFDPAALARDAGLVFIGRVASPWTGRDDCPRSLEEARERGKPAAIILDAPWRDGLIGLDRHDAIILLTWLDRPRDLIVQAPRHAEGPRGVFALRSPARPNPIGLHVCRLDGIDLSAGTLAIEAIDVLDGTPVLDIKPWRIDSDRPGRAGAMSAPTGRRRALAKALTLLLPLAPFADLEAIRAAAGAPSLRTLPPTVAVWLAAVAHIRHVHTDYDRLLAEGYDRDSARFFVIEATNAVLTRWRATRLLDADDPDLD